MGPSLEVDDVHVFSASLANAPQLAPMLDAAERARAGRLQRDEDRARFTLGRGLLRTVLAAYTGRAASSLAFVEDGAGKPLLACDGPAFNVAHAGDLAVVAVARRPVGVDVERVRSLDDLEQVAIGCLSVRERAALQALPRGARQAAFFAAWSRKEALAKAVGLGLHLPLAAFDVEIAPDVAPRLLGSRDPRVAPEAWWMATLDVPRGYVGALALRGDPARVTARRIDLRVARPTLGAALAPRTFSPSSRSLPCAAPAPTGAP